nr:MAG TPA: hypothetical protein [Caudoviricetes sp.]
MRLFHNIRCNLHIVLLDCVKVDFINKFRVLFSRTRARR